MNYDDSMLFVSFEHFLFYKLVNSDYSYALITYIFVMHLKLDKMLVTLSFGWIVLYNPMWNEENFVCQTNTTYNWIFPSNNARTAWM